MSDAEHSRVKIESLSVCTMILRSSVLPELLTA